MINSYTEKITADWYKWEKAGRGHNLAEHSVGLEFPVQAFSPKRNLIITDDSRHTLFGWAKDFLKGKNRENNLTDASMEPVKFVEPAKTKILKLRLAPCIKIGNDGNFLSMLANAQSPISFEIVSSNSSIGVQFACQEHDLSFLSSQLKMFFKEAEIEETSDIWSENIIDSAHKAAIGFGLQNEFTRPIRTIDSFSFDSFQPLFGLLNNLDQEEKVIFQILFTGTARPWPKLILDSLKTRTGDDFFINAPEMSQLAKEKIKHSPMFAAVVRLLCCANSNSDAKKRLEQISCALTTMSKSHSNSLTPLHSVKYNSDALISDILHRTTRRPGMVLSGQELETLLHLPDISLSPSKLSQIARKTKLAPSFLEGHKTIVGISTSQGISKNVSISNQQRLKHFHILGASGSGKTSLIKNLICQDVRNGAGMALIDIHGDLFEDVISQIPESRISDVIIINPADNEFPVGLNILKAYSDVEKELLSSDIVSAFRRLSTSFGDVMSSVLANAVLAFLESSIGGTLGDLRKFLVDKQYREEFLSTISDPNVVYYWTKEFAMLKSNSIGPILTRLDTFLRPRIIRNMISQPEGIDFNEVLSSKKILLVNLPQGLIGAENSFLMGTLIISKIHQAAIARQVIKDRNDFFLYIDECHHLCNASMTHILSGGRKFALGLVLSHQGLDQIRDNELLHSIITNSATRICFRLGDSDAKRLSEGFSFFNAKDLQNLNTGEAIVRVERPEYDFSISTILNESTDLKLADRGEIINNSRRRYARPRIEVESSQLESVSIISKANNAQIVDRDKEISLAERSETKHENELRKRIEPTLKNRDSSTHRYLQTLIKKVAESKGYRASIEMPTPDGKGKVDVSLERDEKKIAVEVCSTTPVNWEMHNIEKCLDAGYEKVFVCLLNAKSKRTLEDRIEQNFSEELSKKIEVFNPDELISQLELTDEKSLSAEIKMKGYKVKVDYEPLSNNEMKRKRDSITKVVFDSLKKLKKS